MIKRAKRTCDKTVVVLMVLLLIMGLLTLFSATYYQKAATGDALAAVKKQLIGVALGAAACVILSRVPYRFFRRPKVTLLLLAISALLLILVIIPGVGVSINGSRRWLNIGGLSMQPSEFAKYAMVVFMAGALDRRELALEFGRERAAALLRRAGAQQHRGPGPGIGPHPGSRVATSP